MIEIVLLQCGGKIRSSMINCDGIITTSKLCRMAAVKSLKYTVFFSGSFCQIYRVTDEAFLWLLLPDL